MDRIRSAGGESCATSALVPPAGIVRPGRADAAAVSSLISGVMDSLNVVESRIGAGVIMLNRDAVAAQLAAFWRKPSPAGASQTCRRNAGPRGRRCKTNIGISTTTPSNETIATVHYQLPFPHPPDPQHFSKTAGTKSNLHHDLSTPDLLMKRTNYFSLVRYQTQSHLPHQNDPKLSVLP